MDDLLATTLEEDGGSLSFPALRSAAMTAIATRPVPSTYPTELTDLLLPENRALPLVARAAELRALLAWLDQREPHLQALVGSPGSGKTRLAIEFCAHAEARGWATGFAAHASEAPLNHANPTVLVVDSVDTHIVSTAIHSAGPRFRVLLLSSSPDYPGAGRLPVPITLPPLPLDDRLALFGNAASAAARHLRRPLPRLHSNRLNDLTDPLHLTMAGLLAATLGPQASLSLTLPELAARLAELEAQRLDRSAEHTGIDPFLLRHLATCITLRHGCTLTAAARIATEEAEALGLHLPHAPASIVDTLADVLLHPVSQTLRPIAPKPLGDAFVANELQRHTPEIRAAIISRATARVALY